MKSIDPFATLERIYGDEDIIRWDKLNRKKGYRCWFQITVDKQDDEDEVFWCFSKASKMTTEVSAPVCDVHSVWDGYSYNFLDFMANHYEQPQVVL